MSLADVLGTMAPALATALGGPLAGLAVGFIAKQFGVDPDKVAAVVGGADPVRMKELDYQFQEYMAGLGIALDKAQIEVNQEEAKSASVWTSGWRPGIGWVCGISMAYVAIIEPVARFIAVLGFGYHGAFPVIDTNLTMQVLFGMLGMSGLRSFDKVKGTAK